MQLGLRIPDFTRPEGPASLGPALARVGRIAEEQGFDWSITPLEIIGREVIPEVAGY